MKILIVLPDKNVGGGQIAALRLAGALAKSHEVNVIYACPEVADTIPPEIPEGVREIDSVPGNISHYFPRLIWSLIVALDVLLPPWRWSRESGVLVRSLNKWYQQVRRRHFLSVVSDKDFDVINSHVWRSDYFIGECKPENWVTPWVLTTHGCYESLLFDLPRQPHYEKQIRKVLNCVDQVLFTASKNLAVLSEIEDIRLYSEPIQVFNGYNHANDQGEANPLVIRENADIVLSLVSRAIPEKGWEQAIQAVLKINSETEYRAKLLLIGSSDYQKQLEQKYQDPDIEFTGHLTNPMNVVQQCDIGLLPSYFASESYPLSVIECISCGKPVIATKIGEIAAMIAHEDQIAGQLLSLDANGKADVSELKSAIILYIENPDLLKAHSALAKQAALKFSMEQSVRIYENIFESCLTNEPRPRP